MGQGTLGDVQDESGDPRKGPGRVGASSGRSLTRKETLAAVRDG